MTTNTLDNMGDSEMEATTAQAKDLVSPEQLSDLMERTHLEAWVQTLSHFGAIGLTGYALYTMWGTWWTVPLFMLQGTLLTYLYAAQHEFSHFTPFKTRWLNVFWGGVCGFLGFFPYWMDRMHHMLHHQYTGVRDMDQELAEWRFEDKPHTFTSYLWWLSGIDYYWGLISVIIGRIFGKLTAYEKKMISPSDCILMVVEAWWYMVGYALIIWLSIYYESWLALQVWILPQFAMKWMHQAHNIAEHYGLPKVSDITSNTRTIYTTPINRWLVWNMTYHTAHHRFANVPFYNLKKMDRLIRKEVKHSTKGYLTFHRRVLSCAFKGRRFGYEGLM